MKKNRTGSGVRGPRARFHGPGMQRAKRAGRDVGRV